MDLLSSLGVNSTLPIQFAQFIIVFVILKYVLFKPYFGAYLERSNRTVGKTELAERYVTETRALEEQFARLAQESNERYKAIYDQARAEATRDYENVVNEARERTKKVADEALVKIHGEMERARTQLGQEVQAVAQIISQKLIGKELNS